VETKSSPEPEDNTEKGLEEKKVEVKEPQEKGSGKEKATSPEPEEN
jgi:hypothetical protein